MSLHLILVCFVFSYCGRRSTKKVWCRWSNRPKSNWGATKWGFPVFFFFSIEFLSHGREFALVVQAQVADRWHFGGGCHFMEFFRICDGNNVKSRIRRLFKGSGSCTSYLINAMFECVRLVSVGNQESDRDRVAACISLHQRDYKPQRWRRWPWRPLEHQHHSSNSINNSDMNPLLVDATTTARRIFTYKKKADSTTLKSDDRTQTKGNKKSYRTSPTRKDKTGKCLRIVFRWNILCSREGYLSFETKGGVPWVFGRSYLLDF